MTDWIALASKHGAKFVERDGEWRASAFTVRRKLPLFTTIGPTQADAAQGFCTYIHVTPKGKVE